MTAETKLAEALENVLPYVVNDVIDCDGAHCNQPCCKDCQGEENAVFDARAATRVFSQSSKVLREWKEGRV